MRHRWRKSDVARIDECERCYLQRQSEGRSKMHGGLEYVYRRPGDVAFVKQYVECQDPLQERLFELGPRTWPKKPDVLRVTAPAAAAFAPRKPLASDREYDDAVALSLRRKLEALEANIAWRRREGHPISPELLADAAWHESLLADLLRRRT